MNQIRIVARCARCNQRIVGPMQIDRELLREVLFSVSDLVEQPVFRDAHRVVFGHDPELDVIGMMPTEERVMTENEPKPHEKLYCVGCAQRRDFREFELLHTTELHALCVGCRARVSQMQAARQAKELA